MKRNTIRKIYELFDEADQSWRAVYRAPGVEGSLVKVEIPRDVQTLASVRKYLWLGGVTKEIIENDATLSAAIESEAPTVRRAAYTGWRNDSKLFVSYRHVAGSSDENEVWPPVSPLGRTAEQLKAVGTLDGWRDIAKIARHSTAMTVALCATFAAPLLRFVHRPSFALVLYGPSKGGKSITELLGASVVGIGLEEDMPSLNATPAGLLATALAANDHMLPINEVATAPGLKRDVYETLRNTTYALMNGHDVQRHPSWSGGNGGSNSFRVIVLFSSEHSPDVWAARNGVARDGGETARLIGVPVIAPGRDSVFDLPPQDRDGLSLRDWRKEQFRRLWEGLPDQRGIAFREYVNALQQNVEAHTARASSLVATFERKVATDDMSPVARDIVSKFGVLFAGGVIARELDILPVWKKEIGMAVRRACEAALADLPNPDAEARATVRVLKERLSGGGIIDLDNASDKRRRLIRSAEGYHQRHKSGRLYVIRAQPFAAWFKDALQARRTVEWLDDEGFLQHTRARNSGRSLEWAQTQMTWPDETRPRSICLFFPTGLDDLGEDE